MFRRPDKAGTIATGQDLVEVLLGNIRLPAAVTAVLKETGTVGAATAVAAYLFS